MKKFLRIGASLMALTLLLGLCGCGTELSFNPQELYCLPKLPAEYTELDDCIKAVLDRGAEYAAPTAGTHVQAVQLVDLDSDGQQEAVGFFRNAEDERPLKIYIFEEAEDAYEQTAVIEGSGSSIYSVAYEDLDGDGWIELVVGWRAGTDLQALSVYSLRREKPVELLRTNYVRYAIVDLDQDGVKELVVFRSDDEGNGLADYYCWQDGGISIRGSARISVTMAQLSQQGKVRKGVLKNGMPALFVTGVEGSANAITDILGVRNGELTNLVLSDVTGMSSEIAPFRGLYPTDINSDGLTDVPWPGALAEDPEEERSEPCWVEWRSYDSKGRSETAAKTYHNIEDGWYLCLPAAWEERISAVRGTLADEATVTFSHQEHGKDLPVLRISALTGSSRDVKAARGSRFVLSRQAETTFTAELLEGNSIWKYGLTEDQVRAAFSLITHEWDDN